ncbi:MAG: phosphatidate cytidylyltransferase [Gammaproteobacteria bacterium]|nr:phosphatidate cytidylyltransferase [Gammaproteobacteria bacterium]
MAFLLPAFLLLPKGFGLLLIGLFILGAAWEWSAFLRVPGNGVRIAYLSVVALLLTVMRLLFPDNEEVRAMAWVSLLWWAAALVCIVRFPLPLGRLTAAACGILVLVPAGLALAALLETDVGGRGLLLLSLAIVWAADVGAFFAGRRFGRVKLAPNVSPGKTWEGVAGGLACSGLTAVIGAAVLGFAAGPALLMGICVAAISVVGDLTVSMFKRNAGLKDSGNIFPGHGGVLDRVDSVTAAAPVFLLLAHVLGWLSP